MKLCKKIGLLAAVFSLVMLSDSHVNAEESELNIMTVAQEQKSNVNTNGWVQSNGSWYYYKNSIKQIGWIQVSGVWYYTNPSGAMQTGWLNLNGTWYYLDSNGFMTTGWLNLNGTWYYLDGAGKLATGWLNLNGAWYYLSSNGAMITGWLNLNGTWYYLNYIDGSMATNAIIDGWNIAANGVATLIRHAVNFEEYQKEVLALVNAERKKSGLKALKLNSKLSNVATLKSEDMVKKDYFDHHSPTYGSPFDMMKAFDITYWTAAENIAMGYVSPERVVNGWMNSPGHKKNIMNSRFTELGVGVAKSDSGTLYWTQMFTGK